MQTILLNSVQAIFLSLGTMLVSVSWVYTKEEKLGEARASLWIGEFLIVVACFIP